MSSYYPTGSVGVAAKDKNKPSLAFDGNPDTFIMSWGGAEVNLYFGGTNVVSKISFIPRYDYEPYLEHTENTIFTIIKENGDEEDCGTLTGTNKTSPTLEAQTYEMPCADKEGVGLKVWKESNVNGWCPAEIQIFYSNRKCL